MVFYVYLWLRENGTPYYVGKGCGDRAFVNDGHRVRKPKNPSRIMLLECPSEEIAFEQEKLLISCYGRKDIGTGILRNMTDGGDSGPTLVGEQNPFYGKTHSPETRARLRSSHTGKKQTEETKAKRSRALKGRVQSKEDVVKRRAILLVVMKNPAIRRRIGEANKGNDGGHVRWHVQRGVTKPGCPFCFPA